MSEKLESTYKSIGDLYEDIMRREKENALGLYLGGEIY